MVAASSLTKRLLIDYKLGEAHNLKYLTDGDWAQDNAGRQWSAGCGCDAQPYFRVFERRNRMNPSRSPGAAAIAVATVVTAATLLILDLLWLGVVARPLYDSALGSLKRPVIFWPAAGLFYALYVGAIVVHAELGASSLCDAVRRGAALGLVAYGTYDLTNWAVLRDWPSVLVLPDIAWGAALTSLAATAGRVALSRMRAGAAP
jgi:uncharacterized membrane protein